MNENSDDVVAAVPSDDPQDGSMEDAEMQDITAEPAATPRGTTPAPSDDGADSEMVVEAAEAVDGDEEVLAAAVVVDDDENDGVALATVVTATVAEEAPKKPSQSRKTRKSCENSKSKRRRTSSADRTEAATTARAMLIENVSRLPLVMPDSHVVRSLGRMNMLSPLFATVNNLFPVGFSCDRYEFSPVLGRVLKLRCTILDGGKLLQKQRELGLPETSKVGPLFRIMWGEGIDDDAEGTSYPYDPYTSSAPITSAEEEADDVYPEEGMRVRVRYEHDQYYVGTILEVGDEELDKKTNKNLTDIRIQYDDGSTEEAYYPDPDITLYLPGKQDDNPIALGDIHSDATVL